MIHINDEEDFGTLAICALRYCMGRQTYMPGLVRSIIKPYLPEISNKDLQVMINDCEYQARLEDYGSDHDKIGWLEWKDFLINEQKRRKAE